MTSGYERYVWGLSKIAGSAKGEFLLPVDRDYRYENTFRWAFVDFTSTEHATAALTNHRNHTLDGRKLKVEYASPDAVRRGGGPRESGKHIGAEGAGHGGKVRKPKSAGYISKKPKSVAEQSTKDGERRLAKERKMEKKERRLEKKLKHKFGGERAPGKGAERPKPGAALALAQRGTAAILPSQGQKITF